MQGSRAGPDRFRIVIVGAGVAGSLVARGLHGLPGLDAICVEQVSPTDHDDAGTGLNIGPNAVKAMATLDPVLLRVLLANSLPWREWRVELMDGAELMRLDLLRVAESAGIRIRWSELYRLLRAAAGEAIRYAGGAAAARRAGPGERGPLCVTLPNGERIEGVDLLIGCDGRYSAVRRTFFGEPTPRQLGVAISRVLVEHAPRAMIDDYRQWFNGPCRLLAFAVPGGVYIAGSVPLHAERPSPPAEMTAMQLRRLYTPADRRPSPAAAFAIEAMCAQAGRLHWARIQDAPALFGDPARPVLLLGDAAHPMAPTLGQGASQAFEDAAACVFAVRRSLASGRPDAADIITAIAGRRLARVRFVQELSWDASDTLLEGSDPVSGARRKASPDFLAQLRRLYTEVAV